jgi:2-hydroxychromene-2-carboxylate isomerase
LDKSIKPLQLEFFFDYSCPWSYLAYKRVRETAMRTGAQIVWKPVLLDRLLTAVNPELRKTRFDPRPLKARYQARNLGDWANFCGLKISRSRHWPTTVEWALKGAIVALEGEVFEAYSKRVFEAGFGTLEDIGQEEVVVKIAIACGLDENWFKQQSREAAPLIKLQHNTGELIKRGGFGCPTIFVGDGMYFGNDQMPLVEMALAQASRIKFVMPGQHD